MQLELRLTSVTPVATLQKALDTYGQTEFISAWHGPALGEAPQPTLVGAGVAVAAILRGTQVELLVSPKQAELLAKLGDPSVVPVSPTAPKSPVSADSPAATAFSSGLLYPQFQSLAEFLPQLQVSSTPDSESLTQFQALTGFSAPLGFFSLGFTPATAGVWLLPQALFVQYAGQAWHLEVVSVAGQTLPALPASPAVPTTFKLEDSSATDFTSSVTALTKDLQAGLARKTVLARTVSVTADRAHSVAQILASLESTYPSCWQFAVAGLAGATPEMLADVRDGVVRSRVLAGTCAPGEEAKLAASEKDLAEHALAAASVSQTLAPLCSQWSASEKPFILRLPNVSHLATDFTGLLAEPAASSGLLQPLAQMHPTAAVCGTPTKAALQLIEKYEGSKRGRYAGPVGWLDATGCGAAGLALRCGQIQVDPQVIELFAGCGIMPASDAEAELAETKAKLKPMLGVFDLL